MLIFLHFIGFFKIALYHIDLLNFLFVFTYDKLYFRFLRNHDKVSATKLGPLSTQLPFTRTQIACLHDQKKRGFLEGRLFSSQSKLFEYRYFLNCSVWLDKAGLPKTPLLFWSCKQAKKETITRIFFDCLFVYWIVTN